MTAELISVGTEILMGNIVNTNAQYLSEKLAMLGIPVYYQTTVGDNRERMTAVIKAALERVDLVILGGGLGPTEDDITKDVTAELMGYTMEEDPEVRKHLEAWYAGRKKNDIAVSNWRQAQVPVGAKVLMNGNGTAPGLILEKNGKTAILLPGPPNELYPMFTNQVYPYLQELSGGILYSKMLKICGIGESKVEEQILDIIDAQTNPTLATYAKTKEVHLRVTAKGKDKEEAEQILNPVLKELRKRFGNTIYTEEENVTLEEVLVSMLKEHDLTITTAESCTGGMISARLVNVSGASDVLKQAFVTYSNKSKRKVLDVRKSTIREFTAVSEKTAKEMALGGVLAADSDCCIAVTGYAGPEGGEDGKPAGTVFVGCCINDIVAVEEYHFNGNRNKVREQACVCGLDMMRRMILDYYAK